jgi:hypothetical protein
MHCNMKTMAKAIAAVIAMAIIAYIALPGAREFVIAFTPILLALICPVMMIGMMWMMRGKDAAAPAHPAQSDSVVPQGREPAATMHKEMG